MPLCWGGRGQVRSTALLLAKKWLEFAKGGALFSRGWGWSGLSRQRWFLLQYRHISTALLSLSLLFLSLTRSFLSLRKAHCTCRWAERRALQRKRGLLSLSPRLSAQVSAECLENRFYPVFHLKKAFYWDLKDRFKPFLHIIQGLNSFLLLSKRVLDPRRWLCECTFISSRKMAKDEKKSAWSEFFWNPRTREFCGRTASSWGKCCTASTGFHACTYAN